jgi:hypothetical protein
VTALSAGWAIGFPLLIGLGLIRAVPAVWSSRALRWGVAFGLGSGLLTTEMFAFARLGLAWSPLRLAVLPAVGAGVAAVYGRRRIVSPGGPLSAIGMGRRVVRIGFALILLVLGAATFVQAALVPVSTWDGFAIWGFKARAFFVDGTVSPAFLLEPSRGYSHPDYPLHLPLLMTWVFVVLGQWHDGLVLFLFPAYYASLLLVTYGALARQGAPELALVITTVLGSLPQFLAHAGAALADLLVAYYLVAAVAVLLCYVEHAERSTLVVAALMAGTAGWTKNEGIAWFALLTLCLGRWVAPAGRGRASALIFAVIGAAVMLPWLIWRPFLGLESHLVRPASVVHGLADAPGRLALIGTMLALEASRISRWNLVWPLFLLASLVLLAWREAASARRYAVVTWSGLGLYVGVYLVTDLNLPWLLSTSLDRLLLHLAPLAVLTVGSAAHGCRFIRKGLGARG